MKNKIFSGIFPATFSVYDENMKVIRPTVDKMIHWQLDNGVSGFYVGGATGECQVLPQRTRMEMFEAVKEAAGDRGKVLAHVGSGRMEDVLELARFADSIGVDAISSMAPAMMPYYNDEEVLDYYKRIAAVTDKPMFAYVTPILQNPVSFLQKAMEIDNMIGAKITIPNYYAFEQALRVCDGDINVFNGPDETMICGLAMGADGAIGTTYNFAPQLAVGIYRDFCAGNVPEARKKQVRLNKLIDLGIRHGGSIAYWKAFMSILGYDMGITVAPRHNLTAEEFKAFEKEAIDLGLLNL